MNKIILPVAPPKTPKQGAIYQDGHASCYLLAYISSGYVAVNVTTGGFWKNDDSDIGTATQGLTLLCNEAEITIKPIS